MVDEWFRWPPGMSVVSTLPGVTCHKALPSSVREKSHRTSIPSVASSGAASLMSSRPELNRRSRGRAHIAEGRQMIWGVTVRKSGTEDARLKVLASGDPDLAAVIHACPHTYLSRTAT